MTRITLMAIALACGLTAGSDAMGQSRSRSRGTPRSGNEDSLPPSVPPPISTLSPTRGIAGPRLERGAVLCGTEQDLQRRGDVNRRIADGEADPGDPLSGCRLVRQERGVEVVVRHGLGRVQVKVKPNGEVGWTDVYLP